MAANEDREPTVDELIAELVIETPDAQVFRDRHEATKIIMRAWNGIPPVTGDRWTKLVEASRLCRSLAADRPGWSMYDVIREIEELGF